MKVAAPQAHVDYGLANIIGVDSVEVNAESTVQIRTPSCPIELGAAHVVPSTCVYGPLAGDIAANPAPRRAPSTRRTRPEPPTRPGTITPASVHTRPPPSVHVAINQHPAGPDLGRGPASPSVTPSTSTTSSTFP